MENDYELNTGSFTLEDQAFLKELGISAMSSGLEYALRAHKEAMSAKANIEKRADGLLALNLDEKTKAKLADSAQDPPSDPNLKLFRDLENGCKDDEL